MTVLITCLETSFDRRLAKIFVREGYIVYTLDPTYVPGVKYLSTEPETAAAMLKDYIPKLDYLLDTTDYVDEDDDFELGEIDATVISRVFQKNVLRPMSVLEAFLPLLDAGHGKRLFFVTSVAASINSYFDTIGYSYAMSKTALHQFIQMVHNRLAPNGYTIRLFDPMTAHLNDKISADSAFNYITRRRGTENHDPRRDDEDNVVIRNALGRHIPW